MRFRPVWSGSLARELTQDRVRRADNGRTKEICVRNLEPNSIFAKAQLLLDASGQKLSAIKRPGVVSTTESVRGVWSAFHDEVRQ